jgi:hypothetical protein
MNNYKNLDFINNSTGHDRTSNRYQTTSSAAVINLLNDQGLNVTRVIGPKGRDENKLYNNHLIKLTDDRGLQALRSKNGQSIAEIFFKHNSNGRQSDVIGLSIYRPVCSNGLYLSNNFFSCAIRHTGQYITKLGESLTAAVAQFDIVTNLIDIMSNQNLTDRQVIDYRENVITPLIKNRLESSGGRVDINCNYKPRRPYDLSKDVFTVYNLFQEYLIKGGISYKKTRPDIDGQAGIVGDITTRGTTRAITGIDNLIKVNQELTEKTLNYFAIAA